MDKEDIIQVYDGILLNHKKEQNNAIYSNMNATRNYHNKWSQKDKYVITYMWNLKYGTYEPTY